MVALISSALYVAAETAWLVRSTAARWIRALGAAIGGFAVCALIVWTLATLIGGD